MPRKKCVSLSSSKNASTNDKCFAENQTSATPSQECKLSILRASPSSYAPSMPLSLRMLSAWWWWSQSLLSSYIHTHTDNAAKAKIMMPCDGQTESAIHIKCTSSLYEHDDDPRGMHNRKRSQRDKVNVYSRAIYHVSHRWRAVDRHHCGLMWYDLVFADMIDETGVAEEVLAKSSLVFTV